MHKLCTTWTWTMHFRRTLCKNYAQIMHITQKLCKNYAKKNHAKFTHTCVNCIICIIMHPPLCWWGCCALHLEKRHAAISWVIPGYPGITRTGCYPGISRDNTIYKTCIGISQYRNPKMGYLGIFLAGITQYKTGYAGISLHVIQG